MVESSRAKLVMNQCCLRLDIDRDKLDQPSPNLVGVRRPMHECVSNSVPSSSCRMILEYV